MGFLEATQRFQLQMIATQFPSFKMDSGKEKQESFILFKK